MPVSGRTIVLNIQRFYARRILKAAIRFVSVNWRCRTIPSINYLLRGENQYMPRFRYQLVQI